jgi:hypothetical protein
MMKAYLEATSVNSGTAEQRSAAMDLRLRIADLEAWISEKFMRTFGSLLSMAVRSVLPSFFCRAVRADNASATGHGLPPVASRLIARTIFPLI